VIDSDATQQYLTGQMRPSFPALFEAFQRDSDAVALTAADIRYGPHPRQIFDVIASPAPWRGTFVYFHAGYWQARDKSLFRFIAPGLIPHGIDVALVNYPLCPDVSLAQLVAATRAAIPAVLDHAARTGRGGASVIAAGHSAGAHIAVELALTDWPAASPIAAVVAISGIYDLDPLRSTTLNDKLRLDPATARAMSPIHRVRGGMPPALFTLGETETAAFHAQNDAMCDAWQRAGNPAETLVITGEDHFSLLNSLTRPSALLGRIVELALHIGAGDSR
jgi:arylformamidase